MYLGFHDYTQTKLDIVFLLDESKVPLTTKEIHGQLGHSNIETIKKIMKELQEDFQEVYPNNEVVLSISKRNGIVLTRDATNLQQFIKYALTNDLTYKIYFATLFELDTDTTCFVDENFISRSSVRRKIQEMNAYLNKIDLHISFGKVMKVNGPEFRRRIMAYQLMSILKLDLDELPIKENTEVYYNLASKVAKYLDISKEKHHAKIAAWIYITHHAPKDKAGLGIDKNIKEAMQSLTFPAKPRILTFFNDEDWELMVLFLSSLNYDDLDVNLHYRNISVPFITQVSEHFVTYFEDNFMHQLSPDDVEFIHTNNLKFYVRSLLYPLENEGLATYPTINPNAIRHSFPAYHKRFNNFYTQFKDSTNHKITESLIYEYHCFFTCTAILPLETSFPTINFYLEADLDQLTLIHLKNRLVISLSGKCIVNFADNIKEAQIILVSTSTRNIRSAPHQSLIEIFATLSVTDLDTIHSVVKLLTYKMVDSIKGV